MCARKYDAETHTYDKWVIIEDGERDITARETTDFSRQLQ